MRVLSAALLVLVAACGDSTGLPTTGTNFAVINRSDAPATVVLHQTDWDALAQTWTERAETAFVLTVQPTVWTCTTLDLDAVSGSVTLPADTAVLTPFWLAESNQWTVTVVIGADSSVNRAARLRGEGCLP